MTKEADHRIMYIMLSRICKFSGIRIKDGMEKHRLHKVIHEQLKMKRYLQEEDHLRKLADATLSKYFLSN